MVHKNLSMFANTSKCETEDRFNIYEKVHFGKEFPCIFRGNIKKFLRTTMLKLVIFISNSIKSQSLMFILRANDFSISSD